MYLCDTNFKVAWLFLNLMEAEFKCIRRFTFWTHFGNDTSLNILRITMQEYNITSRHRRRYHNDIQHAFLYNHYALERTTYKTIPTFALGLVSYLYNYNSCVCNMRSTPPNQNLTR